MGSTVEKLPNYTGETMSAKKIGKPLGGVGAENMQKRKFNLVLDDRLLSKQYVKERILDYKYIVFFDEYLINHSDLKILNRIINRISFEKWFFQNTFKFMLV